VAPPGDEGADKPEKNMKIATFGVMAPNLHRP
jgi:hypothetical protein